MSARWLIAVLAIACAPIALAPGSALARTTSPVTLEPSASHHYRIVGGGGPALPSLTRGAMVRTTNQNTYVVGQRQVGPSKTLHLVLLSHHHGARHWSERVLPASAVTIYKYTQYEAHLSPNAKRVVVSVSSCAKNVLTVVDAPVKNFGHGMTIHRVLSGRNYPCHASEAEFVGMVAQPHHHVTVALNDVTHGAKVASGRDTSTLSTTPLATPPGAHSEATYVAGIARDAATGEITVVGTAVGVSSAYAWTKQRGAAWSAPTPIYKASAGYDAAPAAVTSFAGIITAWVCTYDGEIGSAPRSCGSATRTPQGKWSGYQQIPEFNTHPQFLRLEVNPDSGNVHAVWLTNGRRPGKVRHAAYVSGAWSTATTLARPTATLQGPLSLGLTSAGHPVVGLRVRGD